MLDTVFNQAILRDCLLNLPALKLLGMTLLQNSAHAGFFPSDVPRDTLKQAVIELIAYTDRAQQTAHRLSQLTPVPLISEDLPEYVL